MPSYLITGASRGLGLGFTTELLKEKNNTVIATARDPAGSKGLQALKAQDADGRLHLVEMDVSRQDSVHTAAQETAKLLPSGLDYVISNAGKTGDVEEAWETMDLQSLMAQVEFSVVSQFLLLREFRSLIAESQAKTVLVISSLLGSIQIGQGIPVATGYSIARAALNMTIRKLSAPLQKNDGITIAVGHPGLILETDMGVHMTDFAAKAGLVDISTAKSAENIVKVLRGLKPEDNGKFFNHDGTNIPW